MSIKAPPCFGHAPGCDYRGRILLLIIIPCRERINHYVEQSIKKSVESNTPGHSSWIARPYIWSIDFRFARTMMTKSFLKIEAGEEVVINPEKEDLFFACCDCNLVHRVQFQMDGNNLIMRFYRHNRKTAGLRRYRGIPITKEANNG